MEYKYIVNPKTNRKCRIDSILGKKIIKNYKKNMTGGLAPGNRPLYLDLYDTLNREYRELYREKKRVCKEHYEESERNDSTEISLESAGEEDGREEYYEQLAERCAELEYMFDWNSTENPMVFTVLKYLSINGSEEIPLHNIETDRERATNIIQNVNAGFEDLSQDDIDEIENDAVDLVLPILETWERFVNMGRD